MTGGNEGERVPRMRKYMGKEIINKIGDGKKNGEWDFKRGYVQQQGKEEQMEERETTGRKETEGDVKTRKAKLEE